MTRKIRKTLRERISEIQQNFIEGVIYYEKVTGKNQRDPDYYKYHLDNMKTALREQRLRERDVTYHTRDAEAKLAGERTKEGLD